MTIFTQNRVCAFLCVAAALILFNCSEGNNLLNSNNIIPPDDNPSVSSPSAFSSSSGEGGGEVLPPVIVPPSIFTVSFNIDGGNPITVTLDSGTAAFEKFPNDPVKEGYTFDGWIDEGSGIVYTATTPITKNVTLTSKWTLIESGKAIVSFYTDGGIPATIEPVKLDSGETLGAEFPADPARAGYTFDGWLDSEGMKYTATTPIIKNVALTAKWIIKTYRVTFSRNGGTSATIDPVSVDSGSTLGAKMPANPTRSGYDFAGWFNSSSSGIEYTAQSVITGDLALFAQWATPGTLSSSSRVSSSSSVVGSSSSNKSSSSSTSSVQYSNPSNTASFTETVGGVSFDMVYVPGGTFTLGCEKSSGCPVGLPKPVSGVKVSPYFIGKTEVTEGLYKAVMGSNKTCLAYSSGTNASCGNLNFYTLMEFACELSKKTGKNYRMLTEAEWEYAAKNHLSSLQKMGDGTLASGEEWVYNSWDADNYTGGTDPIGPKTYIDGKVTWGHTQKTRRDADVATGDKLYSRLIRSIDGFGVSLRLGLSKDMPYPPDMTPTCDIIAPIEGDQPVNSYRDPRWVTGSDKKWSPGSIKIGEFELWAWDDGTARLCNGWQKSCNNGQWFTSNNINFVFVPTSGSALRFPYIFLDEINGSVISDKGMNGYIGRIVKESGSVAKPSVSGLKSGKELAQAQSDFNTYHKMVNMESMPTSGKDSGLLDGTDKGWFQDNTSMQGQHHYRKDIDNDEFRFTVNQNGTRSIISRGTWFTVNNTFLRVTDSKGYVTDYLYAITSDGELHHNSYQGYERGDFRMFKKTNNGDAVFSRTCGSICSGEIPKEGTSIYSTRADGKSTFTPAKCPSGGCN